MKIKVISTILIVVVVIFIACVLALFDSSRPQTLRSNSQTANNQQTSNTQSTGGPAAAVMSVSAVQLADATGKGGKPCYIAVDGTVYQISGFALWVDGIHTTSSGRAHCGRDLSEVINQSPHGKSKLSLLKEIGVYQP